MKVVIQRVCHATCRVDGEGTGSIEKGLLVYVGFAPTDTEATVAWTVDRVRKMRIFTDENGKMNLAVHEVGGGVLWVPNFTLYADASSRRPSFSGAMAPSQAKALFEKLLEMDKVHQNPVQSGIFGADMQIDAVADGPVNVVVEHE